MLLSELLHCLLCLSNEYSTAVPIKVNGLSVDIVNVDIVERDGSFVNLQIMPSQVEGLKPETKNS